MATSQVIERNVQAAEVSPLSRVNEQLRGKSAEELKRLYAGLKLIKEEVANKGADAAAAKKSVNDAVLKPGEEKLGPVNFMYLLDEAIQKDQKTMADQELIDAKTTELDTTQELAIYNTWYGPKGKLSIDAEKVKDISNGTTKPPKHVSKSSAIQEAQEKFSADTAKAQGATSQEDATVQASQGQTSSDASNLQMKAQMLQAINQLQNAVASILQQLPSA